MRRRLDVALGVAATVLGTAWAGEGLSSLVGMQESTFPHARHEGLFPLCTGCHEGVPLADSSRFYPDLDSCVGCHDGSPRPRVTWTGPSGRDSNVRFDHREHDAELATAGDAEQSCASCHNVADGTRMSVADTVGLGTCWGCHAHQATEHYGDADCAVCHAPLAESTFDRARIERLPVPVEHESGRFLPLDHGPMADRDIGRCATCHTRERCIACHVDVGRRSIEAMPAARLGLELPPAVAHYNEPASHLDEGWLAEHASQASRDACATCHTSDDCASCHVEPLPEVAGTLPARGAVIAPGVVLMSRPPESHGGAFFLEAHAGMAAVEQRSCATCHQESFCVDCHDAPRGGYHPPDFTSRHAADAFARDFECANCHDAQVFCRACHAQAGLVTAGGGLGDGYHAGGALWLVRHGQAARQGLESCASCHKQVDCTRCHGVLGAFKVSPHSAGFDAERAWARSPRTCLACHIGNPLNGNQP